MKDVKVSNADAHSFPGKVKRFWVNRIDNKFYMNISMEGVQANNYTINLSKRSLRVGVLVKNNEGKLDYLFEDFVLPFSGGAVLNSHSVNDGVLSIVLREKGAAFSGPVLVPEISFSETIKN